MRKNHKKLKAIVLSMVLAAGMMLPASSFAQEVVAETGGGVFGFGKLFGTDEQFDNLTVEEPTESRVPESGGLFNSYGSDNADNNFLGNREGGLFNITGSANINPGGFSNADFGEQSPLGSGIAIMLAAGLGYAALKKKEDEQ